MKKNSFSVKVGDVGVTSFAFYYKASDEEVFCANFYYDKKIPLDAMGLLGTHRCVLIRSLERALNQVLNAYALSKTKHFNIMTEKQREIEKHKPENMYLLNKRRRYGKKKMRKEIGEYIDILEKEIKPFSFKHSIKLQDYGKKV